MQGPPLSTRHHPRPRRAIRTSPCCDRSHRICRRPTQRRKSEARPLLDQQGCVALSDNPCTSASLTAVRQTTHDMWLRPTIAHGGHLCDLAVNVAQMQARPDACPAESDVSCSVTSSAHYLAGYQCPLTVCPARARHPGLPGFPMQTTPMRLHSPGNNASLRASAADVARQLISARRGHWVLQLQGTSILMTPRLSATCLFLSLRGVCEPLSDVGCGKDYSPIHGNSDTDRSDVSAFMSSFGRRAGVCEISGDSLMRRSRK